MAETKIVWAHSPAAEEIPEDAIFVDRLRCTGCWTCSLACMTGNGLKDGQFFVTVRTLGSGEGIDRPAGVWPDLHMSWMPFYSKHCIKCKPRTEAGELPYCVAQCPNKALAYGADAVEKIAAARARGARIYQLPGWEQGKEGVIYASPDRKII
ncbi:MAG: hypothetical protein E7003_02090 [Eggerthellaceae bacterium]|nr:hypothetical protein [Eggerthellaceae bacterium]